MAVHIGIGLFTGQVPPDSGRTFAQEYREVLDLVRLAETLGFDSAWVSDSSAIISAPSATHSLQIATPSGPWTSFSTAGCGFPQKEHRLPTASAIGVNLLPRRIPAA